AVLSSFPTLNNGGDVLTLKDDLGNIKAQIAYDLSWFAGSTKQNGGWSLELVNPFSKCTGKSNWQPSADANGGTPGTRNSVYNIFTDTTAPIIKNVTYTDSIHLVVILSEPADSSSIGVGNFTINQGITINQVSSSRNRDSLFLEIAPNFVHNQTYIIQANGLKDCEGNTKNHSYSFNYQTLKLAEFGDIVMSEIYASPLANTSLPNVEWVELHNNTNFPIKLTNYSFSDGTSKIVFPESILLPDSYAIICHVAYTSKMNIYGQVIGLPTFPSLNNDGDLLTLRNDLGQVIHSVKYDVSWYRNSFKKNGAWSLEMIDQQNACTGFNNWKVCEGSLGGTPGKINSVAKSNPDMVAPNLLRVYPLSNQSLILYFDEPLDTTTCLNIAAYTLVKLPNNAIVNSLNSVTTNQGDASQLILTLNDTLAIQTVYELTVSSVLKDCWGNVLADNKVEFGLPQEAAVGDIAINEILFNPKLGANDFVEIVNKSSKVIDLSNLLIANTDDAGNIKDVANIPRFLLLPQQYVVLSDNQETVKNQYFTSNPTSFVDFSLPSYNDDAGTVVILTNKNLELERFTYSAKMHFATLNSVDGISLERVDFSRSVDVSTNWQSAATAVGGATPAYKNSQYNGNNKAENTVSLSPKVFSPDMDGYNDILNVNYKMPEAGYQGEIIIYNPEGKVVRYLTKQQLLGIEGTYSWNGLDDAGNKVNIGVYIVYFQYFNLKGNVLVVKETVTVAGKF
ncbi:MAG: lamin tail domain-containing protein, partial [Bacteroidetes bacterium]|nr:lamin tail domain-containing protein [Bacteroidota bacterium]